MALSGMVQSARQTSLQDPFCARPSSSSSHEPAQKIKTLLGLDWGDCITKEERKNQIPPAAQLHTRLSSKSQSMYGVGWRHLSSFAQSLPSIHWEIYANCTEEQILAQLLSKYAAKLRSVGKSLSTWNAAASAVSHYTQALHPTPQTIIRNTAKSLARTNPSRSSHGTVPPLQNILDIIHTLYKSPTPNDKRTHFISLLLLLGTKRFSDITRIFRHPRCISVFIRRLDTPTWARAHRFISLQDVHDLGYLTHVACLTHRDYIILKIRPYMAKTAMGQGRLYGGYATFTENRFAEAFCAVKAFFEYIKHTKNFKINTNLKYDKNTIISSIPNNQGVDFVPAAPLLISLNGTPKIGLQSNTVSGIIKRNVTEKIPGIGTRWKPYVLRATSASYKLAYGVSIPDILRIGDWKSTESLYKHYYFKPITSLNPARLYDCQPHDWILPRTYVLLQQPNLP
jgi:hypothetical protein